MKRSCRVNGVLFILSLGITWGAAPAFGQASADPNHLLAFKKIYVEPVQDNVDGAFKAPVEQSFREIFDRNPRFELVSERAQADSILRTIVNKKTSGIDIDITLMIASTGELFTAERDAVSVTATGRETGTKVKQLLKVALKRIPFYGTVSGRDGKELTFDIGTTAGLRQRDVIQISRIDNIKRHPLLKSIVDVQLIPVGSAIVDSVEDTIAFGHVHSEITGETIHKLHKITAIEARMPEPIKPPPADPLSEPAAPTPTEDIGKSEVKPTEAKTDTGKSYIESEEPAPTEERPQLGYVGLGVLLSSFSSTSSLNGATALSGGGFSPGARISGELWLTKNWFADLTLGAASASYSRDGVTNATSISTSTRVFGINAGYKYLPDGNLYGPQVSAKVGYSSFTWSTPVSTAELLSTKSYSGINLGLGGGLPVSGYDWGLLLNINIMLFPGLTEDTFQVVGTDSSASGTSFFLGGYHYFNPKLAVRTGLEVEIFSANATSGGSTTSQKTFGLLTSLLYYF